MPPLAAASSTPSRGVLDFSVFEALLRNPEIEVEGELRGTPYRARIIIPDYRARICRRYRDIAPKRLQGIRNQADNAFSFEQFGLQLWFGHAVEIPLHGEDMVLDPSIRALVAAFGPVILHNAIIAGDARWRFHRNIFPHLRFHTDRGPDMPNRYSCFTRDPSDAAQRAPRESSTLFIANIVAWLEGVRDGQINPAAEHSEHTAMDLFSDGGIAALLGDIVLEQPWTEPDGTGEIAVIDNATVLHATYHKIEEIKGYPIGARYLA